MRKDVEKATGKQVIIYFFLNMASNVLNFDILYYYSVIILLLLSS